MQCARRLLELLVIAETQGRTSAGRANDMLMALLRTSWASKNQSSFRRNWLLSLGATDRTGDGDALTELGRSFLARHEDEAAKLRERVEEFIESEGPELEDDEAQAKDPRAMGPDPATQGRPAERMVVRAARPEGGARSATAREAPAAVPKRAR